MLAVKQTRAKIIKSVRSAARIKETKLMKISRMWSCLLLLGAVLNFSGCDQIVKFFGGGGGGGGGGVALHVTTATVSIKGCRVVDPSTGTGLDPIIRSEERRVGKECR